MSKRRQICPGDDDLISYIADPRGHGHVLGWCSWRWWLSAACRRRLAVLEQEGKQAEQDRKLCRLPALHIPGFEQLQPVAVGGQGGVWRAAETRMGGRAVAIKMQLPSAPGAATDESRTRFAKEVRLHGSVVHPSVVRVYSVVESNYGPCLVMEWMAGGTLEQRVANWWTLKPADAIGIAATIAEAVAAMHRSGVLHLDLKPSNVLFDGEGRPKVSDFGVSRPVGVGEPGRDELGGSYGYMAFEQLQSDLNAIGPRTDISAIGCLLQFIMTGEHPVRPTEKTPAGYLRATAVLPTVRELRKRFRVGVRAGLRNRLAHIIRRCRHPDPAQRYTSAEMLAVELRVCERLQTETKSVGLYEHVREGGCVLIGLLACACCLIWYLPALLPKRNEQRPPATVPSNNSRPLKGPLDD